MPTGLSIPLRATAGRLAIDTGEEQTRKILTLIFGEDASLNPFIARGITSPIFRVDSLSSRAVLRSEIEAHFKRLEGQHRAKLLSVSFDKTTVDGMMVVHVDYMDLRTDRRQELQIPVRGVRG